MGVTLKPFPAAVLGLGLNYSAYLAEIMRGAIESIDAGQMEAAKSLGMYWRHWGLDNRKAEHYFRRAHAIDPSMSEVSRYMVDISLERGENGQAEYWCREVLRLHPDDPLVRPKLEALLKIRNPDPAAGQGP